MSESDHERGPAGAMVPVGEARLARPTASRAQLTSRVQGRRYWAFLTVFGAGLGTLLLLGTMVTLPMWAAMVAGAGIGLVGGTAINFGRQRLLRLGRELEGPRRGAALRGLERLATGPWFAEPVRAQAIGHLAIERLEAGDLDGALRWVQTPLPDAAGSPRRRLPGMGFFGEVVRSLLGWLEPGAVGEVTPAHAFQVDEQSSSSAHPLFGDLRAGLRALELASQGDARGTIQAWSELRLDELRRRAPTTAALLQAMVARIVPALDEGLEAQLERLPAPSRELVLARFPEWAERSSRGYRREATRIDGTSTALDVRAPAELRALETSPGPSALLPAVPLWSSIAMGIASLGILGPGTGLYGPLLLLFVMPVIVGGPYHRWSRLRPFRDAGLDDAAQLVELAHTGTRAARRRGALRTTLPFERGELMLTVGLHRAEQALREGDLAGARQHIAWWLAGLRPSTLRELDLLAVHASALRVATLLGEHRAAELLVRWPVAAVRLPRRRSGRGSAPKAMALASALHHAHAGRWGEAAAALKAGVTRRDIELGDFDRELYGALLRRCAAMGGEIPGRLRELMRASEPAWVALAWPE